MIKTLLRCLPTLILLNFSRRSTELRYKILSIALRRPLSIALPTRSCSEDQLSITLIDLRDPKRPVTASFRGNERVYPASVVKLFYLVAAHRWLEDKKIELTPELTRALRDMIVDSSNEATQYVVDVLTHTTVRLRAAAERDGGVAIQTQRHQSLLLLAGLHQHQRQPEDVLRRCLWA